MYMESRMWKGGQGPLGSPVTGARDGKASREKTDQSEPFSVNPCSSGTCVSRKHRGKVGIMAASVD